MKFHALNWNDNVLQKQKKCIGSGKKLQNELKYENVSNKNVVLIRCFAHFFLCAMETINAICF